MSLKILLADDSMTAQNMGKKILVEAGYDVVAVSNGQAVLKKMPEIAPDLLVLDIYMPGYSGLEVSERIKNAPETAAKPVLLTVGKLEPYQPEEVAKARADGIIIKPFEATDLLAAVEKLASKLPARRTPPPAPVVETPAVVEPTPEPTHPEETEAAAMMASAVEESAKTAPAMPAIAPEFDPALSHFGSLPDGFPLEHSPEPAPQPTVTEAWHNASVISLDFSTPTTTTVETAVVPAASIPANLGSIAGEFDDPTAAPMFIADIPSEHIAPESSEHTEEPAIDVPPFILEEPVAAPPVENTESTVAKIETAPLPETCTLIEPEEEQSLTEAAPVRENQLEGVADVEPEVFAFEPQIAEIIPVEEPAIQEPVIEEAPAAKAALATEEGVSVEQSSITEEESATELSVKDDDAPAVIPDSSEDFASSIDLPSEWPIASSVIPPENVENAQTAVEAEDSHPEGVHLEASDVSEADLRLDSIAKNATTEVVPEEENQSIELGDPVDLDDPARIEFEPVEVVPEVIPEATLENQKETPAAEEDLPVPVEASPISSEQQNYEELPVAQTLEALSAEALVEDVPGFNILAEQAHAQIEPALPEDPVIESSNEPTAEVTLSQEPQALLAEEPVEEPKATEPAVESVEAHEQSPIQQEQAPEPLEKEQPAPAIEHSLAQELESLVGEKFTTELETAQPVAKVPAEPSVEIAESLTKTVADISANRVGDVVQRVFDRYKTQMIEDIVRELAKHE